MSTLGVSFVLGGLILAVLAGRATLVVRRERGARRGSLPGTGHHTLTSEYFSGGGGGGQAREYIVPRDPQDYARLFVPKQNQRQDRSS